MNKGKGTLTSGQDGQNAEVMIVLDLPGQTPDRQGQIGEIFLGSDGEVYEEGNTVFFESNPTPQPELRLFQPSGSNPAANLLIGKTDVDGEKVTIEALGAYNPPFVQIGCKLPIITDGSLGSSPGFSNRHVTFSLVWHNSHLYAAYLKLYQPN